MGKIIQIKEENLIPESLSKEPIYPASISRASYTKYKENYPGTPEIHGEQTIDVETDLKNLWDAMGPYVIKPETYVKIAYDGKPHGFTEQASTMRYVIEPRTVTHTEVGTYTYTATLKTGYIWRDMTTDPVTITMEIYNALKVLPTTIVSPVEGLVFSGLAQNLVTVSKPSDYTGEITFSLDKGTTWTTDIPQGLNAGSYSILVKCAETSVYEALEFSLGVTISCYKVAYPKITATKPYTGSAVKATYLDGTEITYAGTLEYEVLSSSILEATDVSQASNNVFFKPRTNYVWESTSGNEVYTLGWYITKESSRAITWNTSTSYNVGGSLPAIIATVSGADLVFSLYEGETFIKTVVGGEVFTTENVGKTYRIFAEYAKDYPNYGPISQPWSSTFVVNAITNVVEWDSTLPTSIMIGKTFTLKAKATNGKIIFRDGSSTGNMVGDIPTLIDGYYQTTWKPGAAKSYTIYACNYDVDTTKYPVADAVSVVFSVNNKVQNVISWSGDTNIHYVGDVITFPEDAVSNPTYTGKQGIVKYYKGDFRSLDDGTLPLAEAIVSPYTVTTADVSGLTISAFNANYDSDYTTAAAKVVKSLNIASRSADMVIGTYSPTAYIDTTWTIEVTIPSGTIDFRLKTSSGWSSMAGDSRAVITPLGNNVYKLEYKFIGPSGRVAAIQIHNTPAVGYKEPSNQDTEISIGILSKANVITRITPTTEEISIIMGEKISASAQATSGYVQFYDGNPDDTVNPGTLITDGYVSGLSGEPCSISNYLVTKSTSLIYMKNVGYDGSYTQAENKYFKVYASEAVNLKVTFDADTSKHYVGNPLTYSVKIKDTEGHDFTSDFNIEFTINDVVYPSGSYTPTEAGTVSVKATVTNPKAKSGYVVYPAYTINAYTIEAVPETLSYNGYNASRNVLPTTDAEVEAGEAMNGFTNRNYESAPYNSPKSLWIATKKGCTVKIVDQEGEEALELSTTFTSTKWDLYYYTGPAYANILTFTISK